jgi:RNA-directed DNA polymerase
VKVHCDEGVAIHVASDPGAGVATACTKGKAHATREAPRRRELKEVFRRYRPQPIDRVISLINPTLRGWVNYFAVGHSSECLSYIKDWVEKKVRRQLAQARRRKGFCWKRWNRSWLYDTLRLFNGYRLRRDGLKAAPAG